MTTAVSPYLNHYYDKSDAYAWGQYDGYQMIPVNSFKYSVNPEYAAGVKDGRRAREEARRW